jgi:hypothetical protein
LLTVEDDDGSLNIQIPEAPLKAAIDWVREAFDSGVENGQISSSTEFGQMLESK